MEKLQIDFGKFVLKYLNVRVNVEELNWNEILKGYVKNETTMKNEINLLPVNRPGLMYINWYVATYFDLDSLLVSGGKSRERILTEPRQICYYIAYKTFHYKQQEVADFFGKESHVTILSGIKRMQNLMDTEPHYLELILMLTDKISNGNNYTGTDTETSVEQVHSNAI